MFMLMHEILDIQRSLKIGEQYCYSCKEIFNSNDLAIHENSENHKLNVKRIIDIRKNRLNMEIKTKNIVKYATHCHSSTNHLYDGMPYSVHLESVVNVAIHYINLIPKEAQDDVLAACWCHDLIEDARQSYNDVKNETNMHVADIVYAVTTEKGRNRNERNSNKYYEGIKNIPYATFVKLCDRIANYEYSATTKSSMFTKYSKEMQHFKEQLYTEQYDVMFNNLDEISKTGKAL